MDQGVVVLMCALVFTGVMGYINTKAPGSQTIRVTTFVLILMGMIISLICLWMLFSEFLKVG